MLVQVLFIGVDYTLINTKPTKFKNGFYHLGLKGMATVHEKRTLDPCTAMDSRQLRTLFNCKHGLDFMELEGLLRGWDQELCGWRQEPLSTSRKYDGVLFKELTFTQLYFRISRLELLCGFHFSSPLKGNVYRGCFHYCM